jgi:hypothetical protein
VDDNSAGRVPELGAAIKFKGTGTWNGTVSPSVLSFETLASAGGGTVQRMVIANSGDVGIGTGSPESAFHISRINSAKFILEADTDNSGEDGNPLIEFRQDGSLVKGYIGFNESVGGGANMFRLGGYNGSDNWDAIVINPSNGRVGVKNANPSYELDVTGTIRGNNVSPSDRRLKENISKLTSNDLRLVTGFQYNLKSDGSFHYGVIAQEVEKIFPHMVSTDDQGMKSVAYNEFIPLLIEAYKEQIEINQKQNAQITELSNEISELKKLLLTSLKNEN